MGPVRVVSFPVVVDKAAYQYLSNEAVESIGREDYVRMVACLGQHTTDEYFREKRAGLT
jgi:hypothetical protein